MKLYPYILSAMISLFALSADAMEINKQNKKYYAEFSKNKFANRKFPLSFLIQSLIGRNYLLQTRTAEKTTSNLVKKNNGKLHCIPSSLVYDTQKQIASFVPAAPTTKTFEEHPIKIAIEAVTDIEWLLENYGDEMAEKTKKLYEKSRRNDLRLLRAILENDNTPFIQELQPNELLDELKDTQAKWPPEEEERDKIFSPLSGYCVIQSALEVRKRRKIDAVDMNNRKESWTHKIFTAENTKKETE